MGELSGDTERGRGDMGWGHMGTKAVEIGGHGGTQYREMGTRGNKVGTQDGDTGTKWGH